jgi:hypothetical protein
MSGMLLARLEGVHVKELQDVWSPEPIPHPIARDTRRPLKEIPLWRHDEDDPGWKQGSA